MSRNISSNVKHLTEDELAIRNTENGKLIITDYRNRECAMLINNNRLISASVVSKSDKVGNIYIAKVKNKVKNIEAYFVEISEGEMCFLSAKDTENAIVTNRIYDGRVLEGDEIFVQITRDKLKTKLAAVGTSLEFSKDYFVIKLAKEPSFHISKKIKDNAIDSDVQNYIKDKLCISLSAKYNLNLMVTIRTAAADLSAAELMNEFDKLYDFIQNLLNKAFYKKPFTCLLDMSDKYISTINRIAKASEYNEIITDSEYTYTQLVKAYSNASVNIRLYNDPQLSLNILYSIDSKMNTALSRQIWLKSGGYLIIEQTEAMTIIDVNSGKIAANSTLEETIAIINNEAALEIANQLRLRNLSGIIMVDFINIKKRGEEREFLNFLKSLYSKDPVPTKAVDITALGILEITRKKIYKSLHEQFFGQDISGHTEI